MLHLGDDNLVARVDEGLAPTAGDEVDGFSRAAREDDFGGFASINELRDARPRRLIHLGRLRARSMSPTMHIRVLVRPEVAHCLNHGVRLLRGRRVV
jgi:hypothetical protein